ncbi:MAG: hypothetical protein L0Z71_00100 [Anaerolineae bacterium]|nr:hypothetical protein [Anaerolineae bacterium]
MSTKYAIINMIYAVMLLFGFNIAIGFFSSLIEGQSISTSVIKDIFLILLVLVTIGVIFAIIPTIIGARKLATWLSNRSVTPQAAFARGAVIGAKAISFVTIPFTLIIILLGPHGISLFSPQAIIIFIVLNLPIMVCAALAGGRTGLQLAKFIKAENPFTTSKQ